MQKINIADIVNEGKFNRFHLVLLILCCLIITFDMFDLVIYSSIIPLLMENWSITPVQAGAIGSYGPFGMMVGAIVFGTLADKIGRKKGLIICVALFSLFTFLCAFAPGPASFSVLRFLTGLGIGGVMPNVIALLTDYAPKQMHNLMVSIVMCCFPVGGILASLVGIYFIPHIGWRSVFWVAAVPLLLIPFMIKFLHDSPAILLVKGKMDELCIALKKVNPHVRLSPGMEFESISAKDLGSPVAALFKNKRSVATILIWVTFFMCLLMINGMTTWLPNLMFNAGYALNSSLTFMLVLNIGAIFGTLILGRMADKYGAKKVLVPMFAMSAICLTLLGFKSDMLILYLLVAIVGACTTGAQNIAYSFVSQYYSPLIRSTAVGFASGIGRIGAIIGPTFGGVLFSLQLSDHMNFLSFAIPGIICAVAFAMIPMNHSHISQNNDKNSEKDSILVLKN